MNVVIMENNSVNTARIFLGVLNRYPEARVTCFNDGEDALAWCQRHSDEIDLFFGNWWNVDEEPHGPEGANIAAMVQWQKKPKIILCGESEMFRPWSKSCGADGFLLRPVNQKVLQGVLDGLKL